MRVGTIAHRFRISTASFSIPRVYTDRKKFFEPWQPLVPVESEKAGKRGKLAAISAEQPDTRESPNGDSSITSVSRDM